MRAWALVLVVAVIGCGQAPNEFDAELIADDPDRAITELTHELNRHPHDARACYKRAYAWVCKEEYDKALADLEASPELQTHAGTCGLRGWIWMQKGDDERALEAFDFALRLDPMYADAHVNRGYIWLNRRQYEQAVREFGHALNLGPSSVQTRICRAYAYSMLGEHDKALADLDECARLQPENSEARWRRANELEELRRYSDALADYRAAVRLDPRSAWAHIGLAFMLAACTDSAFRDGPQAIEAGMRACELSAWSDPYALEALAAAYEETDDHQKASTFQEIANQLYTNPEDLARGRQLLDWYAHQNPLQREAF